MTLVLWTRPRTNKNPAHMGNRNRGPSSDTSYQPQPALLWTNTQKLSGSLHTITTEILQLASSVTSDQPSALHLHFPKCKKMEWNILTTWTSGITLGDRLIAIRSSQGRANSAMAIVNRLSTYQFHFIQLFNYHHKYTQ